LHTKGFKHALSEFDRRSKTWNWQVAPGLRLSGRYDHIFHTPDLFCTGAAVRSVTASDDQRWSRS